MTTSLVFTWPLDDTESRTLKRVAAAGWARGAFVRLRIDPDARTTTLVQEDAENPEPVGVTLRRMLCRGVIYKRNKTTSTKEQAA